MKIVSVVGARPNFMKVAPIISETEKYNKLCLNPSSSRAEGALPCKTIHHILVHTGQHYDEMMSDTFFKDLNLPEPNIYLNVGSASHAVQTANIMTQFEKVCLKEKPDWILVVGDVNSTIACTLVAAKLGIRVGHIEAGLRSFDRTMPEEINRLVTDTLADLLFTPSQDADENLLREGILANKIKRVGNIMIDTLLLNLDKARELRPYKKFKLKESNYAFVTLHRPSNVDSKSSLSCITESLVKLSQKLDVIFPVHPRTLKQLKSFGLWEKIQNISDLKLTEPLNYHDAIGLVDKSRFVLTDSGGLQEETTFLNIPCLTLRPNTERPITIKIGTNKLTSLKNLEKDIEHILNGEFKHGRIPEFWDGNTGKRIIDNLIKCMNNNV